MFRTWELGQEAGIAECRRSGRRPDEQAKAKGDKSEEGIKSNRLEEKKIISPLANNPAKRKRNLLVCGRETPACYLPVALTLRGEPKNKKSTRDRPRASTTESHPPRSSLSKRSHPSIS